MVISFIRVCKETAANFRTFSAKLKYLIEPLSSNTSTTHKRKLTKTIFTMIGNIWKKKEKKYYFEYRDI